MLDLKIDTSYPNYDGISYYSYEYLLQTPIEKVLDGLLSDLNGTALYKNKIALPINSWRYEDTIYRFIRVLFRIPTYNYTLYNHYVNLLFDKHTINVEFQKNYIEPQQESKQKKKTTNKKKVPNIYVRSETHNIFTGEVLYDYTNFATGDSFVSSNPDLLEELNAPKKKKSAKKEPRKDFGKILINFKLH